MRDLPLWNMTSEDFPPLEIEMTLKIVHALAYLGEEVVCILPLLWHTCSSIHTTSGATRSHLSMNLHVLLLWHINIYKIRPYSMQTLLKINIPLEFFLAATVFLYRAVTLNTSCAIYFTFVVDAIFCAPPSWSIQSLCASFILSYQRRKSVSWTPAFALATSH